MSEAGTWNGKKKRTFPTPCPYCSSGGRILWGSPTRPLLGLLPRSEPGKETGGILMPGGSMAEPAKGNQGAGCHQMPRQTQTEQAQ